MAQHPFLYIFFIVWKWFKMYSNFVLKIQSNLNLRISYFPIVNKWYMYYELFFSYGKTFHKCYSKEPFTWNGLYYNPFRPKEIYSKILFAKYITQWIRIEGRLHSWRSLPVLLSVAPFGSHSVFWSSPTSFTPFSIYKFEWFFPPF